MNCISEALFGYNEIYSNSFDFKSYMRYLSPNLRMYKILYPSWKVHISLDEPTYNSPYKSFFDYHLDSGMIDITVLPHGPLCKMMLYRMVPLFLNDENGIQKYDRVVCRDVDSLPTYRERQAVEYWMSSGRIAHGITDSVSHNISLMGGMIGFQTSYFRDSLHVYTFDKMLELATDIDLTHKGSDQCFLNRVILPLVANSMTEHYILGLPQSFRGDCFNYIQDVSVGDIAPALRETNILVNHIGQAGFIMEPVLKFLKVHERKEDNEYFEEIEKRFSDVYYWHK